MLCSSRSPLITKHPQMPRSAGVQKNHITVFFFLRYHADINFTNYSAHAKPTQCFQSVLVETNRVNLTKPNLWRTCTVCHISPQNKQKHIYKKFIIPSFFLLNLKSCSWQVSWDFLSGHSSSLWIVCFHRQKWWKESDRIFCILMKQQN